MVNNLDEALRMLKNAVRQRKRLHGLIGNCAELLPESLPAAATHDSLRATNFLTAIFREHDRCRRHDAALGRSRLSKCANRAVIATAWTRSKSWALESSSPLTCATICVH
jgi:hypothetical protein